MWNCIKSQIDGNSDISLSAGNTGVLLVVSRMILKMMDKVSKPALAGLWPNQNDLNVVLDLGANIECNDNNLVDFAELGSALHKSLFPKKMPKVSLLNIGSEEIKGTEALKSAYKKFITDSLKESLTQNLFSKISLIFSYFSLKKFKNKLDPRKYNGAIFLGLNGPVVKSHGGTDALGFYYSIDLCYKIVKGNLMKEIKKNLNHLSGE